MGYSGFPKDFTYGQRKLSQSLVPLILVLTLVTARDRQPNRQHNLQQKSRPKKRRSRPG